MDYKYTEEVGPIVSGIASGYIGYRGAKAINAETAKYLNLKANTPARRAALTALNSLVGLSVGAQGYHATKSAGIVSKAKGYVDDVVSAIVGTERKAPSSGKWPGSFARVLKAQPGPFAGVEERINHSRLKFEHRLNKSNFARAISRAEVKPKT